MSNNFHNNTKWGVSLPGYDFYVLNDDNDIYLHYIDIDEGYNTDAYLYLGTALNKNQFVEVVYNFFNDSMPLNKK